MRIFKRNHNSGVIYKNQKNLGSMLKLLNLIVLTLLVLIFIENDTSSVQDFFEDLYPYSEKEAILYEGRSSPIQSAIQITRSSKIHPKQLNHQNHGTRV